MARTLPELAQSVISLMKFGCSRSKADMTGLAGSPASVANDPKRHFAVANRSVRERREVLDKMMQHAPCEATKVRLPRRRHCVFRLKGRHHSASARPQLRDQNQRQWPFRNASTRLRHGPTEGGYNFSGSIAKLLAVVVAGKLARGRRC